MGKVPRVTGHPIPCTKKKKKNTRLKTLSHTTKIKERAHTHVTSRQNVDRLRNHGTKLWCRV